MLNHLKEIKSRIGAYQDDQANADASILYKSVEYLLKQNCIDPSAHRPLIPFGISISMRSSQTRVIEWQAAVKFGDYENAGLDDYTLEFRTIWGDLGVILGIALEIGSQIGVEWKINGDDPIVYMDKSVPANMRKFVEAHATEINFKVV